MTIDPPDLETLLAAADLSDRARDIARAAFLAGPARSTHSGPANVASRVADGKVGWSLELESRTLETAQWLRLRHHPRVLRYVSQPAVPVVVRCSGCARPHRWRSTADFFFLELDRAGWIETRTEKRIARLVAKHPGLYRPTAQPGEYDCPSAAAYAAERDLVYLVRTQRFFDPIETRNLAYLATFEEALR